MKPAKPKYELLTWDADRETFTPQKGLKRGPWTKWGLRKAARKLRNMGYDAHYSSRFPSEPSILVWRMPTRALSRGGRRRRNGRSTVTANSRIEWRDHTFNPWRGCTKVSPGCANCYAEAMSKRNPKTLGVWGDAGTRVVASDAMWREPLKWNRAAAKAGEPALVFCASLADVCEDRVDLIEPRIRLKRLIEATPHLRWLLLSKRPENYPRLFYGPGCWPPNVWVGTSAEDQPRLDERLPHLRRVPAALRFLSLEPLLGPIDLSRAFAAGGMNWVVVGGESGPHARPCNLAWIRDIVRQCKTAGVPCFVKQVGAKPYLCGGHTGNVTDHTDCGGESPACRFIFRDRKGGDPSEWGCDLRVREFPCPGQKGGIQCE